MPEGRVKRTECSPVIYREYISFNNDLLDCDTIYNVVTDKFYLHSFLPKGGCVAHRCSLTLLLDVFLSLYSFEFLCKLLDRANDLNCFCSTRTWHRFDCRYLDLSFPASSQKGRSILNQFMPKMASSARLFFTSPSSDGPWKAKIFHVIHILIILCLTLFLAGFHMCLMNSHLIKGFLSLSSWKLLCHFVYVQLNLNIFTDFHNIIWNVLDGSFYCMYETTKISSLFIQRYIKCLLWYP